MLLCLYQLAFTWWHRCRPADKSSLEQTKVDKSWQKLTKADKNWQKLAKLRRIIICAIDIFIEVPQWSRLRHFVTSMWTWIRIELCLRANAAFFTQVNLNPYWIVFTSKCCVLHMWTWIRLNRVYEQMPRFSHPVQQPYSHQNRSNGCVIIVYTAKDEPEG